MTDSEAKKGYFKKHILYILLAQIIGVVLIGVYQIKGLQTALMTTLLIFTALAWWKIDSILGAAYKMFTVIFKRKG